MNRHNENAPREPSSAPDAPMEEHLPDELLWAAGGHASDIVLTALADGQHAIVPPAVQAHIEHCSACMAHLGNSALLSLHVDRQLAIRAEHDLVLAKRPLPRLAIGLGLAFALLGLVPSILDGETTARALTANAPLFLGGLGTLLKRFDDPGNPAGLVLTYAAAGTLVAMGFALVRFLPKLAQKESSSR